MSSRNYPFNDYPYQDYPYRSYPYTDFPYGSSGDQKGRVPSSKTGGAPSPGSLLLSLLVLAGFIFWLAFKILKLIYRLVRAIFSLLANL
jgi:hypothetical protein